MIEFTPKQRLLLKSKPDTIVYGGARGGGKSVGLAGKMALEVTEWYSEAEAKKKNINIATYRNTANDPNFDEIYYYKYLIDYPDYAGVVVRRTDDSLMNQFHPEAKKIYPFLGGKWVNKQWVFPSGATIVYRPCKREEDLDWFQGQNKQRLGIEELTQFEEYEVEEIESCCRSANPYIKAMKVYTTNPGKKGHKWVKEKYIDKCPALKDGDPVYLEEFDLTYQPLKPNKPYITPSGEEYLFIPSLVFDNKHLSQNDKQYIRNLMGKNEILKRMWLFGDWDIFAGQFFSMWDENIHVRSELDFFNAADNADLILKRREFDWSDWRLYMSNDYGFAERSAWACGFYAVSNVSDEIVKFGEIVESGLTIKQQAKMTKETIRKLYNLKIDDFEMVIADPKSYWQRQDKGDEFWDFAKAYEEEGIHLTKGINDREQGAMAFLEALRVREDNIAQMTFLDCCTETVESIPNLPADRKNPNDVDTTVFDHCYDEGRYFLMVIKGEPFEEKERKGGMKGWRKRAQEASLGTYEGRPKSWKVA